MSVSPLLIEFWKWLAYRSQPAHVARKAIRNCGPLGIFFLSQMSYKILSLQPEKAGGGGGGGGAVQSMSALFTPFDFESASRGVKRRAFESELRQQTTVLVVPFTNRPSHSQL